jgi:hypothetical protein
MASPQYPFYFAWVYETDTTFGPEHEVVDEDIFSFDLEHEEGQHPTLDLTVKNPRIGLLNPGRKVRAWLSMQTPSGVVPLFFGVLIGVPTDMFKELVTLKFIARSPNSIENKQAVAETMKVRPYWDPVFIDQSHRDDPDAILEGWSALWHTDRTTLDVTASDILTGEDGTIIFNESEAFYDSVSMTLGQAPLTDVRVEATVGWTQRQERLLTDSLGVALSTYTGESFMSQWPKPGTGLGGGWNVEQSFVLDTYGVGETPIVSHNTEWHNVESTHENCDDISIVQSGSGPALLSPNPLSAIMSGEFTSGDCDPFSDPQVNRPASWHANGIIVPLWSLQCTMGLRYQAKRQFSEMLSFDMKANTQGIITSPFVQQSTELISVSGADVGEALVTYEAWSDFLSKSVGLATIIFPNDPTKPGGLAYQVCVQAGTAGSVEPEFSDIPGTVTVDNTVHWASIGTSPGSVTQRMAWGTSYGAGQILFYQAQIFDANTGRLVDDLTSTASGYYLITAPVTTNTAYTERTYLPVIATSDQPIPIPVTVEVEEFTPVGTFLGLYPPNLYQPIGGNPTDVTARCYFPTDRGQWSVEHLICKARARLRMRARAVTVGWDCPIHMVLGMSCRMNAQVYDHRLPGGQASGKVVKYSMKADGHTGVLMGHVEIGCAVGYNGTVSSVAGTPEYTNGTGYMQPGYQKYDGGTVVPTIESDIGYTPPAFYPFDDGLVFPLNLDQVTSRGIGGVYGKLSGNTAEQAAAITTGFLPTQYLANVTESGPPIDINPVTHALSYDTAAYNGNGTVWELLNIRKVWTAEAVPAQMQTHPITWTMDIKSVQNGPFNGSYSVAITPLEVPQGIDLEAASSP